MRADAESSCTESRTDSWSQDGARNPWLSAHDRIMGTQARSKDLEIIVLRHQLAVLRRQIDRPELTDADRTLLGAIAAALARPSRAGWLVTPGRDRGSCRCVPNSPAGIRASPPTLRRRSRCNVNTKGVCRLRGARGWTADEVVRRPVDGHCNTRRPRLTREQRLGHQHR